MKHEVCKQAHNIWNASMVVTAVAAVGDRPLHRLDVLLGSRSIRHSLGFVPRQRSFSALRHKSLGTIGALEPLATMPLLRVPNVLKSYGFI